ncbi:glutamate ABC transporter substrate-binding protein [Streptomyces chumphonensis]|uniref:Glutamate ABC transporter substrate-binding protein n=1 Tax=Streptomyces chumphonensis TaxID=1214925 RepID=A0A927ID01_9ACTN|nr:glutamate ABC transporter substrate-binding protein [Streptomyces chumphonensis]MBD3932597.1 glutamate ABC transporter substrate-binding protein [Streptomyces chumphonensis]
MRFRKTGAAVAAALALAVSATACGSDSGSDDTITIGIKFDQPGLGLKTPDGAYEGFDVDVATYVAKELGYEAGDIEWKQSPSPERENLLSRGDVDMIAATYSITDERKEKVSFAGPYLIAHQDLLIRSDETAITDASDLNDKNLCSVGGSTSAQNVKNELAPDAELQEFDTYSKCLDGLSKGTVDALTTDDAILAGYAAQDNYEGQFKLAGLSLSDENYGIGLKKGDTEMQEKVNAALEKMIEDGSWKEAVDKHFGPAGYDPGEAPEITEKS